MSENEREVIQGVLGNPQGYGQETVREICEKARGELARLWRMEASLKQSIEHLTHIVNRKPV